MCTEKLQLVAKVNRTLNKQLMNVNSSVKDVIEALEKINTPTLHLVAPSYYLLQKKLRAVPGECRPVALFRAKLRKFLDQKFWTSISALHWIASFLDPTFKNLQFLPQMTHDEIKFKTDLRQDLGFGQMDPSTDGISETETDSTARSKLMRRRGVWYYYFFTMETMFSS